MFQQAGTDLTTTTTSNWEVRPSLLVERVRFTCGHCFQEHLRSVAVTHLLAPHRAEGLLAAVQCKSCHRMNFLTFTAGDGLPLQYKR